MECPCSGSNLVFFNTSHVATKFQTFCLNSKRPCLLLRWENRNELTHILLLASGAAGLANSNALHRNGESLSLSLADGQRPGAAKYIRGLSGVGEGRGQVYKLLSKWPCLRSRRLPIACIGRSVSAAFLYLGCILPSVLKRQDTSRRSHEATSLHNRLQ